MNLQELLNKWNIKCDINILPSMESHRSYQTNMKEYGILYSKTVFPKENKLYWLNFCHLSILPKDLEEEIKNLSIEINLKYKDVIVVPMDNSIIPGCVTLPEAIKEVSNSIYQGMLNIFKRLSGDENCIRLVYGVGELPEEYMKSIKSTHEIESFPIMIKIGHFLDYGLGGKECGKIDYTPGIFKV